MIITIFLVVNNSVKIDNDKIEKEIKPLLEHKMEDLSKSLDEVNGRSLKARKISVKFDENIERMTLW